MLLKFGEVLKGMQDRKRDERGFTLIELLVVVIIIGILAAIAIPTFLAQRGSAQEAAAKSDLRNGASAAVACSADNAGVYTSCTQAKLDAAPYNWKHTAGVTNVTVTPGADTWKATAKAANGTIFTFDTATGTVTP